jgi:hypothetical protein
MQSDADLRRLHMKWRQHVGVACLIIHKRLQLKHIYIVILVFFFFFSFFFFFFFF